MPSNVPSTYHHPRTYLSPREMDRLHENLDKLSQFRQLDMWELMAHACHLAYLRGIEHANADNARERDLEEQERIEHQNCNGEGTS